MVQQIDELHAALTRIDEKLTTYGTVLGTQLVDADSAEGTP